MSTYVKSYGGNTKWMNLFVKDDLLKNIMIFGIKSVIALKNDWIANLSTFFFLKTTIWSYGEEVTDFHARKIPEAGSNYIFGQ